jgi:uncharacterized protein YndB with AHSA1/START domain
MEERIEKKIEIAVPVSRVWKALTDSKQFGEWFLVKMDGPFVARQPICGQITHPGYEHVRIEIFIKEITPETYFSYTWHPFAVDKGTDYSDELPTLVEFFLEPNGDGTLLKVTESGFENVPAERRAEAFRRNDGGWAQQMKNIEAYVYSAAKSAD